MSDRRSLPSTHGGAHAAGRRAWRGLTQRPAQRRPLALGADARLRRPASGSGLVPRAELVARLLRSGDIRVVLLAAGAGFGKTTLLTQWDDRDERPFAWLSLDASHDDPAALMADVDRALQSVADRGRPFVLVLDDLHVLGTRQSLTLVAALAGGLSRGSQLALAGRHEPALPLARWAVEGALLRVGVEELAMTPSEASLLLGAGLELASGELDALLRRTEGWAAGLRMARIGRRERPGGVDRLAADYLRDEVLAPIGPEAADFLVRTSPLDRLSGPLCDAVLGRHGSGLVLREMERTNLFVRPLDGALGWYRCHRLLADVLRAELRLREPALEVELHRRASRWHETSGDPAEAIRHARAAGDGRRAGDLVWASLLPLLGRGELGMLARWLAEFADGEIAAQPTLALAAAWCGLERGDVAAALRWAAVAECGSYDGPLPGGPASPAAAAAIVRAESAGEGLERMARDAALGRAGGPTVGPWAAVCDLLEGVARRLRGDQEGSRASLTSAERLSVSAPSLMARALAQLAALAADEGDWEGAAARVAQARAASLRGGVQEGAGPIEIGAVAALVGARLGQPAEAAREARRCLELLSAAAHVPPWLAVDARILLARASLLVGNASVPAPLLREARRALARMPEAGTLGLRLDETWRQAEAFPLAGMVATAALSRAELRVLRYLPTHLSYREIGERLHVSQCTVKTQALSAYRKLDVSSRSQAVDRAAALGLIEAGAPASSTPDGGSSDDRP